MTIAGGSGPGPWGFICGVCGLIIEGMTSWAGMSPGDGPRHPHCTAPKERERPPSAMFATEIQRLAQWVHLHAKVGAVHDHACAQCISNGEIVVNDYECTVHLARRIVKDAIHASAESLSSPWPPRDVVKRLADGVNHLLLDHDCGLIGHEGMAIARDVARTWLGEDLLRVEKPCEPRMGQALPDATRESIADALARWGMPKGCVMAVRFGMDLPQEPLSAKDMARAQEVAKKLANDRASMVANGLQHTCILASGLSAQPCLACERNFAATGDRFLSPEAKEALSGGALNKTSEQVEDPQACERVSSSDRKGETPAPPVSYEAAGRPVKSGEVSADLLRSANGLNDEPKPTVEMTDTELLLFARTTHPQRIAAIIADRDDCIAKLERLLADALPRDEAAYAEGVEFARGEAQRLRAMIVAFVSAYEQSAGRLTNETIVAYTPLYDVARANAIIQSATSVKRTPHALPEVKK